VRLLIAEEANLLVDLVPFLIPLYFLATRFSLLEFLAFHATMLFLEAIVAGYRALVLEPFKLLRF